MKHPKIEVGNIYGYLTVVDIIPARSGAHHKEIVVKCICGSETYTRQYPLQTGAHKSCGCKGIQGYNPGDKVFEWTIIGAADVIRYNGRMYDCICSCGNTSIVSLSDLRRGASRGCFTCGVKTTQSKTFIPYGRVYKNYKNGAANRGLPFELSFEDAVKLFKSDCHYCKSPLSNSYSGGGSTWHYNGIDRKDNSLGYTIDNCVPCCRICNIGKAGLSYEDYLNWIKGVAERVNG